jgi:hypothetical protein
MTPDKKAKAEKLLGDLGPLPGRLFDNRHRIFSEACPQSGRLVMVGSHGNSTDANLTNKESLQLGFGNQDYSHIDAGLNGAWGRTQLPKRLVNVTNALGFFKDETVYTNTLLMCGENMQALRREYERRVPRDNIDGLIAKSMRFFLDFTVAETNPSAIVVIEMTLDLPQILSGGCWQRRTHPLRKEESGFGFAKKLREFRFFACAVCRGLSLLQRR